jgi:hypothetical protein
VCALFYLEQEVKNTLVIAGIALALGMIAGVNIHKYQVRQHEKTTAVMVLLQMHRNTWELAVQGKLCPQAMADLTMLQFLSKEIGVVLPLADSQDKAFHQHAQKMNDILATPAVMQCPIVADAIKQVRGACDECHREYR